MEHCGVYGGLHIYTSAFQPYGSRMYALTEEELNKAVLIDAIEDCDLLNWFCTKGIQELQIILTHEHYDHISGVNYWRSQFPCEVICTKAASLALPNSKKNLSKYNGLVFSAMKKDDQMQSIPTPSAYVCTSDLSFENKIEFPYGKHQIELISVGGHSGGSLMARVDGCLLFTGDNFIPDTATILFMPGGNVLEYAQNVKPFLLQLSESTCIFPGHGEYDQLGKILSIHPDYTENC